MTPRVEFCREKIVILVIVLMARVTGAAGMCFDRFRPEFQEFQYFGYSGARSGAKGKGFVGEYGNDPVGVLA